MLLSSIFINQVGGRGNGSNNGACCGGGGGGGSKMEMHT